MIRVYLSPVEKEAVIDAVKILAASVPPTADGHEYLCSALPKLDAYFSDHDQLVNIAAIAHNAVVWFTGDRKRMFHKLGDLAEALLQREGSQPDEHGNQLQMEAVRIRRVHGFHVNS